MVKNKTKRKKIEPINGDFNSICIAVNEAHLANAHLILTHPTTKQRLIIMTEEYAKKYGLK